MQLAGNSLSRKNRTRIIEGRFYPQDSASGERRVSDFPALRVESILPYFGISFSQLQHFA